MQIDAALFILTFHFGTLFVNLILCFQQRFFLFRVNLQLCFLEHTVRAFFRAGQLPFRNILAYQVTATYTHDNSYNNGNNRS